MGFWVVGSIPTIHNNKNFRFPHVGLEKTLPGIPRKWNGLDIDRGPRYILPTCYPAVSGGESVIRLSLGKLLVHQLQVVERTNTLLIPLQKHMWRG